MNIRVNVGGTDFVLNDSNYLTEGGEGQIFKVKGQIIKILTRGMEPEFINKLKLLSTRFAGEKNIVYPVHLVFDSHSLPIGYSMMAVENATPLSLYFAKSYRQRNGVTPEKTREIYQNIWKILETAHMKKSLMVDGNELNYLIHDTQAYAIDVDSWQIDNYPSTAIMASIEDFSANRKFTEQTDWYSFGVLAMQLFSGIHPYRGIHPNFKPKELERRQREKVSVFDKDVVIPPAINLDDLPPAFKAWAIEEFAKGGRSEPPFDVQVVVQATVKKAIYSSTDLIVTLTCAVPSNIRKVHKGFVLSEREAYQFDGKSLKMIIAPEGPLWGEWTVVVKKSLYNQTLIVKSEKFQDLKFDLTTFEPNQLQIDEVEGPILLSNDLLYRFKIDKTFHLSSVMVSALTQASKIFQGVVYTNLYGRPVFTVPRGDLTYTVQVPALVGHHVLDCWSRGNALIVISEHQGNYHHTFCLFNEVGQTFIIEQTDLQGVQEVNAVLINGKMLVYIHDDLLTARAISFTGSGATRTVKADPELSLFVQDAKVFGWKNDSIYQVELR